MRVPLGPRTELPPAEVRRAGVAVTRLDLDGSRDCTTNCRAADQSTTGPKDREPGQVRVDDAGRRAVVVDLDKATIHRGAPLRCPQVLHVAVDAPYGGQLDIGASVVHAVRDPPEAGIVAARVHLPRTGRTGAVAGRALRVATLHTERVALEAKDVVQREAAGHREAELVVRMAIERGVHRAVVAAARVVQGRRHLRISPGLIDAESTNHVRILLALVVERRRAEAPLRHREVRREVAAATARLAVVLERDRRRDAVAELRRVGDAVDAESAGI